MFQLIGMDGSVIHDHHRPQINQRVPGYSQTPGGFELYDDALVSSGTLKQVFTRARLNGSEEIDYGLGCVLTATKVMNALPMAVHG